MSSFLPSDPCAGFLRRAAALALDVLFVSIVLSVVGAAAFTLSNGRVQTDGLLPLFSECGGPLPIPPEINPEPVLGDAATACSGGALPFVVSQRSLTLSVTALRGPAGRSTTFVSHFLSPSGVSISAFDADWLGRLGFAAYCAVGLVARGRTFGMRLMGIRLSVRDGAGARRGVPLALLFVRTCIAIGGLVLPGLAFIRAFGIQDEGLASMVLFVGIVGPIAWIVVNVVLIANGRDPVYDKLAGLTVLVVWPRS